MRDDLELLSAWREGDREAGGQLFDRYFAAIRRFFRSKVGDDYEELVQRTFARCVESQAGFRGEGKFRSYLFGIAANVLRAHLRDVVRHGQRFDPEASSVADLDLPGPSTALGARREHQVLLEALRRLPLDDQIVLELFYWEQMTSSEIAQVLALPHGTVRSRLRLARDRLRGHVDELARSPAELESLVGGLERWAVGLRDQLK
ncbi:MAG: sigma-70 family RNA polymerase sigma factor [Nannocystaceae bacterium]